MHQGGRQAGPAKFPDSKIEEAATGPWQVLAEKSPSLHVSAQADE